MTAKRTKKTYSPAERRRRNRRFNTILYIISAILILGGIVLIISDQTLLFPTLFQKVDKIVKQAQTGEVDTLPTIPPFEMHTWDPNMTQLPWHDNPYIDPNDPYPWVTEQPQPGVTSDPNATPRPTREPSAPATERPYYAYEPKTIYFLDEYIQASITSITCPVDPVGYNRNGQMDTVRSAFRAGWFMYGGDPVRGGNTLIAGHNRYSGKLGYFSIIKDKMAPGDMIIVEMRNGEYAYYVVDTITQYPYDAVPNEVMYTGGAPRLTLITCLGDYSSVIHTSRHRVIAVCYRVYFGDNGGSTQTEAPIDTDIPALTSEPVDTQLPDITKEPNATIAP